MDPMDVDGADESKGGDSNVDEQLYSRQLYVIDHESMKKMQQSAVLIAGMNGLGAEIAKNTILAGVKSVTIFDPALVRVRDLGSNFYLNAAAVGKQTRAHCSLAQLQSLNPYVRTECITDAKATLESLLESAQFDVVVLANYSLSDCIRYNTLARKLGIRFVSCDAAGVFGQVFVDFGEQFECSDLTGEPPRQGMVVNISKAAKGVVQVHDDARHGLSDGDFVRFTEVEGMTELNAAPAQPIKVTTPFAFEIGDTSAFGDYAGNGLFFQVKQGAKLTFAPLAKLMALDQKQLVPAYPGQPLILQSDFGKDPFQQHLFYRALQSYRDAHNGQCPSPDSADGAKEVFAIFSKLCADNGVDINDDAARKFTELARCASCVISPMCAFLGGIAAQEVLKACSHKFTPLQQLLYYDAFECLPTNHLATNDYATFATTNSRYDDYLGVFGAAVQQKVLSARMFLVGAGAIGCETLKNWALMGVGCGDTGEVIVTDMDQIEVSNLNRQFLFRRKDVSRAKSDAAAEAVCTINPSMNITAQQNRVGKDSENVYTFDFWRGLTAVCTALDNVDARLYVDAQCVTHGKALLESGTLGTKGNTQIVVPRLTQSYGSTRDPAAAGVPICTLKNFPHKMEHCIQWARDVMEGDFTSTPMDINSYLERGDAWLDEVHKQNPAEERDVLLRIAAHLDFDAQRPLDFAACVHWARRRFEEDHANKLKQLLYNFPVDAVTTEGAKFWSPPKRAPQVLVFDEKDALHMGYVIAAANLRAAVYGLKGIRDADAVRELLKGCVVPEYVIDDKAQIAATDEEEKKMSAQKQNDMDSEEEESVAEIRKRLPDRKELIGMRLKAVAFEKDDATNFHMDFVFCAANLRARNYRIAEQTQHDIKKIAGNIIPAIATSTALVTGLIAMEFYKLLFAGDEERRIEDYRSCFVNLALPLVTMSEPGKCEETVVFKKGAEWRYTLWDSLEIENGREWTVQRLLEYFDAEWDCELNMLSYGNAMLYAFYMDGKKLAKRKGMTLVALVEEVCKIDVQKEGLRCLNFEVNVDYNEVPDGADEEVMLPTVVLYI